MYDCFIAVITRLYKVNKMTMIKDNKKNAAATNHKSANRPHPSVAMAVSLIKWMNKNDNTPPSVIISQGLALARSNVHDGLPVDQLRKNLVNDPKDNQVIIKIMAELRSPGVNKVQVLADILKAVWVRKTVFNKVETDKQVTTPVRHNNKRPAAKKTVRKTVDKTAPQVIIKRRKSEEV